MNVSIGWHDEATKTVIYEEFHPNWTWDDYIQSIIEHTRLTSEQSHTVDVIADFSNTNPPPKAIVQFNRISDVAVGFNALPNAGKYIMVGLPRLYEVMTNIYKKTFQAQGERVEMVNTLDEALARVTIR